MSDVDIFGNDWRDCLKAHFMYTIKVGDTLTTESLAGLLLSANIPESVLAELRVRATMHVDEVGKNYEPDLGILDEHNDHHHSVHETPRQTAETTHVEAVDEELFMDDSDEPGQLSLF